MSSLFFPYNLELQYSNIFERFGALDCMLVLEYIWIFEYPPVFFAGYLDIWSLGAALPRGQGGKIGNLPNQQPPRAPEIVPHKKENFKKLSLFLKIMITLFISRLSDVLIYERMLSSNLFPLKYFRYTLDIHLLIVLIIHCNVYPSLWRPNAM